jgi:hypothetical protein
MKFEANTGSQVPNGSDYCINCERHKEYHEPSTHACAANSDEAVAFAHTNERLRQAEAATAQGVDFSANDAVLPKPAASALDVQQGGDHYKKLKIQPIEYIHANGIPFAEGSIIKYVTRWRDKDGIKDLKKARHFLDMLIELETRGHAKPD